MSRSRRYNRNSFMGKVRTVFFIYTEASAAVFMLFGALLELLCAFGLKHADPVMSAIGFYSSAVFALIGLTAALWVMHQAREHGIIGR